MHWPGIRGSANVLLWDIRSGRIVSRRATGKSAEELLAILKARLVNDPATERRLVRGELGKINRIRLERMLGEGTTQ